MIGALRALAGDALLAIGEVVRGGSPDGDGWTDPRYMAPVGAMESDGPDLAKPIPPNEIRDALEALPDSELLNVAANIIDGHRIFDFTAALVVALRDRAAQFEAVELDAGEPFLTLGHLGAHLHPSRRGE